jgi:hypothetical protein
VPAEGAVPVTKEDADAAEVDGDRHIGFAVAVEVAEGDPDWAGGGGIVLETLEASGGSEQQKTEKRGDEPGHKEFLCSTSKTFRQKAGGLYPEQRAEL